MTATITAIDTGAGDQKSSALMTTQQAAVYLGIGKSTLEQSRVSGINCPPFVKLGTSVRYRPADLDLFIAGRIRTSTAQAA